MRNARAHLRTPILLDATLSPATPVCRDLPLARRDQRRHVRRVARPASVARAQQIRNSSAGLPLRGEHLREHVQPPGVHASRGQYGHAPHCRRSTTRTRRQGKLPRDLHRLRRVWDMVQPHDLRAPGGAAHEHAGRQRIYIRSLGRLHASVAGVRFAFLPLSHLEQ